MNAVDVHFGLRPPPGRDPAGRNRVTAELKRLLDELEASPNGFYSPNLRTGILADQLMLFYYARGEEAIGRLYRSTINPHPVGKPSKRMVALWRKSANQVQALVETLKRDYKFTFDERTRTACGL